MRIYICLGKVSGTLSEGKCHVMCRRLKKCGQYLSEKLSSESFIVTSAVFLCYGLL